MPDRQHSAVEVWILQRSKMTALCMDNAHVHALMHLAVHEGWSVEKFLEESVLMLGQVSAAVTAECLRLQLMQPPPPIIVNGTEYRFNNPERVHGNLSDPEGPVRGEGLR